MTADIYLKAKYPTSLTARLKLFFMKDYFRNHIIFSLICPGIFANLINWIIIPIFIRPPVPTIILHYNVYFGVDVMGDWKRVFYLPAIGLFLLIINNFLAYQLWNNKERIASYVLLTAAAMVQLCLLIATFSVIIINY